MTLTYTLAEELRDKGFPHDWVETPYIPEPKAITQHDVNEPIMVDFPMKLDIELSQPNLEELIEACGEEEIVKAIQEQYLFRLNPEIIAEFWLEQQRLALQDKK